MKQCYPKIPLFIAFFTLIFYHPESSFAQCMCSDGTPAKTEVHTMSLSFPSNSVAPLTVPQFQPSAGTLMCVNAQVFLTSIVRMRFENDDVVPVVGTVRYIRSDTLTGPGISPPITGTYLKTYGPYNLGPTDDVPYSGPDYVMIGPDTVYNDVLYDVTTSNVVAYLGNGTVTFNYVSNVSTDAKGADYYNLGTTPQNKLRFVVSYSYCDAIVLKLNLKNFQAILKDPQNVFLSWSTLNENKNNNYEIELSENGSSFKTIGTTPAKPANGASAEYNYQYHPDQPVGGKLYFRIKQVNGKTAAYSDVRIINMGSDAYPGLRIYPNPVVRNINLEFDRPLSGDFRIELSNQVGQIIYTTQTRMNNNAALQVQVNNPPPPGVYYLRATQAGTNKVYSGKLLFTKLN